MNLEKNVKVIICCYTLKNSNMYVHIEKEYIFLRLLFQPDYDDIEDDYSRAIKHPIMNEEKRSKHDDRKKYGEE